MPFFRTKVASSFDRHRLQKTYRFAANSGTGNHFDRHSQRAEVGPRPYVALLFLQPFSLSSFLGFFVFVACFYNDVDFVPGMDVR